MGRKQTTGRFETREQLVQDVWWRYLETKSNLTDIAVATQVSPITISKIIDNGEGRPSRAPAQPLATKPALVGDVTRTARARAHLERLGAAKGKRVVVDLYAAEREALEHLVATGYAQSQSDAIRKALTDAAKQRQ